jgi:hypothetical protein
MTETLKVVGCAREAENSRALTLFFNRTPTDDEMRAVHNAARDFAALPELVAAAKRVVLTAQRGLRTADFHRMDCACYRCEMDALAAILAKMEGGE